MHKAFRIPKGLRIQLSGECLPTMCKALGSVPSTEKIKQLVKP